MTEDTALDLSHQAMSAAPDDDALRLRFYERLAESELFLMLAQEAGGDDDTVEPEVFVTDAGQFVLVFDREERLAAFAGQPAPFVALSGRAITGMLRDQDIGIGLNLDVAPSSILLPASAVAWLYQTLGNTPDETEARISDVHSPAGLPEALIHALDAKLATAMGLAQCAYLVGVTYDTGVKGHLLAFVAAVSDAQPALARAAAEALTFSGIAAGAMDVAFFRSQEAIVGKLDRVGLRFDLPQLQQLAPQTRAAPGSDPDNPPKLK